MGLPRGDYGPRTNAHRGEYGPGPWSTFTRGLRRAPGRKPRSRSPRAAGPARARQPEKLELMRQAYVDVPKKTLDAIDGKASDARRPGWTDSVVVPRPKPAPRRQLAAAPDRPARRRPGSAPSRAHRVAREPSGGAASAAAPERREEPVEPAEAFVAPGRKQRRPRSASPRKRAWNARFAFDVEGWKTLSKRRLLVEKRKAKPRRPAPPSPRPRSAEPAKRLAPSPPTRPKSAGARRGPDYRPHCQFMRPASASPRVRDPSPAPPETSAAARPPPRRGRASQLLERLHAAASSARGLVADHLKARDFVRENARHSAVRPDLDAPHRIDDAMPRETVLRGLGHDDDFVARNAKHDAVRPDLRAPAKVDDRLDAAADRRVTTLLRIIEHSLAHATDFVADHTAAYPDEPDLRQAPRVDDRVGDAFLAVMAANLAKARDFVEEHRQLGPEPDLDQATRVDDHLEAKTDALVVALLEMMRDMHAYSRDFVGENRAPGAFLKSCEKILETNLNACDILLLDDAHGDDDHHETVRAHHESIRAHHEKFGPPPQALSGFFV